MFSVVISVRVLISKHIQNCINIKNRGKNPRETLKTYVRYDLTYQQRYTTERIRQTELAFS